MKVRVWNVIVIAIIALVIGTGIGSLNPTTSVEETNAAGVSEGLTYHSLVRIYKNGELIDEQHNTLMDEGKEFLELQMGTAPDSNGIDRMQLGNTTAPSSSDTTHDGLIATCGFAEAAITWVSAGTGNMTANNEWTSTCDGVVVNTTGLDCNGCAVGIDYFAGTDFVDATFQTDDKLNVTWWVGIT